MASAVNYSLEVLRTRHTLSLRHMQRNFQEIIRFTDALHHLNVLREVLQLASCSSTRRNHMGIHVTK